LGAKALGDGAPRVHQLCRGSSQLATCAIGNVVICYSGQTPGKHYLEEAAQAILAYGKGYPSGMGLLILISADEPPPDEAARKAILDARLALKPCMCASVLVVEGEGFAASAKRSIIAMFNLAPSVPFPTKVAGNIAEGAAKLAKLLGPRLDPQVDVPAIVHAATGVRPRISGSVQR
jgi:hypothetical protein